MVASFVPTAQSACPQTGAPPHVDSPQTLETSLMQVLSHAVVQQYGSVVQIFVTHGSHPVASCVPDVQSVCEHDGGPLPIPASTPVSIAAGASSSGPFTEQLAKGTAQGMVSATATVGSSSVSATLTS